MRWLNDRLVRALGDRALVSPQLPLSASDVSEPEPDLAVIERRRFEGDEHPDAATLIIEVAGSSRLIDLRVKAPLYAAMGVPDYWVVDPSRELVVVHRRPATGRYLQVMHLGAEAEVAVLAYPDVSFRVVEILAAEV